MFTKKTELSQEVFDNNDTWYQSLLRMWLLFKLKKKNAYIKITLLALIFFIKVGLWALKCTSYANNDTNPTIFQSIDSILGRECKACKLYAEQRVTLIICKSRRAHLKDVRKSTPNKEGYEIILKETKTDILERSAGAAKLFIKSSAIFY